jgi:S-DNA-T family DNA segregation ATPase FtsK/SpoIIIE
MEAPIPGKSAIGIEVPNEDAQMVTVREVLESDEFKKFDSPLAMALGKDISGKTVIADIGKMPHLLIAGSTGSGKSVCVNTLISSILYKAKPDEVKLLLIDPKVVELANYNGIPHLLIPVVTDPKKAASALNWAVVEMNRRYKLFADTQVKDISSYNEKAEEKLPKIVIIIDELADLMMASANDVEDYICRLAQMARAAGMHLIVATQRPSVDVITGVIKANIPSRIAFAVSSQTDSRTILDMGGAEKLLGKGDMLFYPLGAAKPIRLQGAFISEGESERVIDFVKSQIKEEVKYEDDIMETISKVAITKSSDEDDILSEAIEFIVESGQGSASMLQRKFKIGFNRAARLIDSMEERGIVGKNEGSKPRKVLMTKEDLQNVEGE